MCDPNNFDWTEVDEDKLALIQANAADACLGGISWVRGANRLGELGVDQLVGQLGEYALARRLGDEDAYFRRRARINENPHEGDDGSDFDGESIDVKCSLMRYGKDPCRYRLPVRPAERKSDIYVAAFVTSVQAPIKIYLAGWAFDADLPPVETDGIFEGAHVIPVPELRPLDELPCLSSR